MLKTIVMIGIMRIVATIRGVTRYWIGSTAKVVSASICSVMRIEPSSVAMPDPARAVIMSAVNTGASSCASEMPDGRADEALLIEDAQRGDRLLRGDGAREEADQQMMGSDPTPTNSICSRNSRSRNGRRKSHASAWPSIMRVLAEVAEASTRMGATAASSSDERDRGARLGGAWSAPSTDEASLMAPTAAGRGAGDGGRRAASVGCAGRASRCRTGSRS